MNTWTQSYHADPFARHRYRRASQTLDNPGHRVERIIGTTAALVMGGLAAAGSIGGAAIQAGAAGSAANAQETAAQQIRQQAIQAAQTAASTVAAATKTANTGIQGGATQGNAILQQTLAQQKAALQPYINAGALSLGELQQVLSPTGALAAPQNQFSFTDKDYANSPEFNFIQTQANQALSRSAAASGGALSGGLVRASDQLNTGLASTYLDQAFNRALSTYNTNRQNLLTRIQGLTNVTGLGFNATGAENQDLGVSGQLQNTNVQNAAGQIAANTINSGTYAGNTGLQAAQIGEQAIAGAANAQSAADLASGKAWGGAVSGLGSTAAQLYGLTQLPQGWGNYASVSSGGLGTPSGGATGLPTTGAATDSVTSAIPTAPYI